jgi:hypothetical protein
LSNDIFRLNESIRVGKKLAGQQLTYPEAIWRWEDPTVSSTAIKTTGLNTIYRVQSNATIYGRGFNHGNGQFSYAAINYYRHGNPSGAELYVYPFQINQTTGAIVLGTPSQVIFNTATGAETSTSMWGHAGSHAWFFGYLGQHYVAAWTVSNNVVSGIQSTVVGAANNVGAPRAYGSQNSNEDAACIRPNGSVSYFAPGARTYDSTGALRCAYDWVWSYNGSNLTLTRENALDATNVNDSSQWHFTNPVWPQYSAAYDAGTAMGTKGIRQWNTNAGATQIQSLGSQGQPLVNYHGNTLYGTGANITQPNMLSLELSNGKVLTVTQDNAIYLLMNTDGTMSNVSEQVRIGNGLVLPGARSRIGWAWPCAQDTWWIGQQVTPVEYIKIYVNPTTLEITYLDSILMNYGWQTQNRVQSAYTTGSTFMTGTDKQFFVTVSQMEGQGQSSVRIKSIAHGRKGN